MPFSEEEYIGRWDGRAQELSVISRRITRRAANISIVAMGNELGLVESWRRFSARHFDEKPKMGRLNYTSLESENRVVTLIQAEAPPLREDATGALRVGNSRVLLELVVRAFQDGATPETIVQRYSTLALADVYAVIAYYLHHRSEIDAYLTQREQKAEKVRQRLESQQDGTSGSRPRNSG